MKPIVGWPEAYEPDAFAEKHGLTLEQARIVISSNGPSRRACDIGAVAFLEAVKARKGRLRVVRRRNAIEGLAAGTDEPA